LAFATKRELRKHRNLVHDKRYLCGELECGQRFGRFLELRKHRKEVHHHEHVCETCGLTFPADRRQQYRVHLATHDPNREIHTCSHPNCGKIFTTIGNLNVHIKVVHEGLRPFACVAPNCNKAYPHKISLKRHIAKQHPDWQNERSGKDSEVEVETQTDDETPLSSYGSLRSKLFGLPQNQAARQPKRKCQERNADEPVSTKNHRVDQAVH